MKCIFIYNPNSGKGRIINQLDYIKNELKRKYGEVDIYPTKSQEDTIETAKRSCHLYDAIVFSGGDGTFNDIVNGVSSESIRPPLGYIPSGTVNDIARNLKIPRNVKKALKVITEGKQISHDVGLINDRHFVYVAGTGMLTAISYRTKQKYKKILGKFAYILDGISDVLVPNLIKVKVTTKENEVYEGIGPLILVLNSISVGGIPFNKKGHLNDGNFELVVVKKFIGHGLASMFRTFVIGIRRKRITKYFHVLSSNEFNIEVSDECTWTLDGEKGMNGEVFIKNLHNHINIFVPMKDNKPKSKYLEKQKENL